MLEKAFAENAMINENTTAGVINLHTHRHENQAGNKIKYGFFADIYLCKTCQLKRNSMFDLKTQPFNFSSAQEHQKIGITKIAPPLPSSKVNDNCLLLSVTQTELNDMVDDGGGLITSKPIFGKGQKEYNHFYRRPSIPF